MRKTEDEVRPQAIENVASSEVAGDLLRRYLNEDLGMHEYIAEIDDLLETEIGYLLSGEHAREERHAREIDDARSA